MVDPVSLTDLREIVVTVLAPFGLISIVFLLGVVLQTRLAKRQPEHRHASTYLPQDPHQKSRHSGVA